MADVTVSVDWEIEPGRKEIPMRQSDQHRQGDQPIGPEPDTPENGPPEQGG